MLNSILVYMKGVPEEPPQLKYGELWLRLSLGNAQSGWPIVSPQNQNQSPKVLLRAKEKVFKILFERGYLIRMEQPFIIFYYNVEYV